MNAKCGDRVCQAPVYNIHLRAAGRTCMIFDIRVQTKRCAALQTSTQLGVTDVSGTYRSNQNDQLFALRYGFSLCRSRSETNKCTLCTEQPMSLFTTGHIASCKASSPQSEI